MNSQFFINKFRVLWVPRPRPCTTGSPEAQGQRLLHLSPAVMEAGEGTVAGTPSNLPIKRQGRITTFSRNQMSRKCPCVGSLDAAGAHVHQLRERGRLKRKAFLPRSVRSAFPLPPPPPPPPGPAEGRFYFPIYEVRPHWILAATSHSLN